MLFNYAKKNNLLEMEGWKWLKTQLRDAEIINVCGHKKRSGGPAELLVQYDDGDKEWRPANELEPEKLDHANNDVVVEYVKEHNLLGWRDLAWVSAYTKKVECQWLSTAQQYLSDRQRLYTLDLLRKKLHSMYNKLHQKNGPYDADTILFGRAYKLSNDIGKHGGNVSLPYRFRNHFSAEQSKYIDFTF